MRQFNQNDCFDTLQDTALRTYIKNLYSCNGDKVSKSLIDKVRLFVYRYQKKNSKEELLSQLSTLSAEELKDLLASVKKN